VPLDAYEEAQFHRITAQLRQEDPALGRTGRWHRAWHGLGPVGAGLLLLTALVTLPLALVSNLYPLGLFGYVAATFAGVRLGAIYLPRLRQRSAQSDASQETAAEEPSVNRAGLLWGALVGAAALAAVIALAPGSATDRGAITDRVPDAPAASSVETGSSADQVVPDRRSIERSSVADGS
jgi:hypothetical protein